jgi:PAS domain S-box-containing protein
MNLFSAARLRTRLMLLALIAVFPAWAVIGYTAAFAGADQMLWPQRWLLGFVSLAALGAALIGGEVFVLRPIRTLRSSLDRLAAGDLSARAQLAAGAPGLSELGSAVNAMAIALEARQREREGAHAVLRTLSTALEQSPENVIVTDRDGRIEYVNAAFETLTGYSRAEAIGQTPRILKAPGKYRQDFYENLWQTILGGGVFEAVLLNQKKNGDVYYEEKTIAPVRDVHGTITHFVSTGKDITERQRATVALKASEAKFRLVMENTASAIFIYRDERFVYVNRAAERLTGCTRDELLEMQFWDLVHPDSRDLVKERGLARQRGERVAPRYEVRIRTRAGEERWIEITATRTLFDGQWSGFATVFDITSQKETSEALLASETQLRQLQKMEAVGRLAGGVAHDFNNLLTAILGYGELALERLGDDDSTRADVQQMLKAADRAARLTKQLLAFSRQQAFQPRVLGLNDLITDLDKMLRRLISEDIEVTLELARGLWATKVDPTQIEQVVMNLVVNARDAMPDGGKLLVKTANAFVDEQAASAHLGMKPGEYIVLSVADTGCGMTEHVQAHVFEPFFTTKALGKGTGLGLATVYGIVKQSGGYVAVESTPERGSTFTIYLPRVHEPVTTHIEDVRPSTRGSTETILLVEDEIGVRSLTARILTRQGYTVLEAGTGDEAMRVQETHPGPIDLLLTDMVMPGMNGHVLAQTLQRVRPTLKVLWMSGYADSAIREELKEDDAFLTKPFKAGALVTAVRRVLLEGRP